MDRHDEASSQSLCANLRTCLQKVKPYIEFMSGPLSVSFCNYSDLENKRNTAFNCQELLKTEQETNILLSSGMFRQTFAFMYLFIYVPHIYFRWFISRHFVTS